MHWSNEVRKTELPNSRRALEYLSALPFVVIWNRFFFSSRRRHTRFDCDWSSDVCSSDLLEQSSVESFLPLYEECRRWKDRRMRLQLPLFPGYVFVHLALRDRLKVLRIPGRSEEHTSELQSQSNLVCRLLLEKKKQRIADC